MLKGIQHIRKHLMHKATQRGTLDNAFVCSKSVLIAAILIRNKDRQPIWQLMCLCHQTLPRHPQAARRGHCIQGRKRVSPGQDCPLSFAMKFPIAAPQYLQPFYSGWAHKPGCSHLVYGLCCTYRPRYTQPAAPSTPTSPALRIRRFQAAPP